MTHIISIGNSQGIRIPKATIQQAGLLDAELILTVVPEGLLITPVQQHPREGWAEAFQAATLQQDDELLLGDVKNQFDTEDWEW